MHMHEVVIVGIGLILILGIVAQWVGWRLNLPAILPLLIIGFVVGPLTGILNPDELLGELLFPVVSISVAVILFEGGLSLKREDLAGMQTVVRLLVSVGVLITWLGSWLAAALLFDLDLRVAAVLGAILVVSGPTVVIPLLRHIRPVNRVRSVLQWEGILVDPVGATLAVLVVGGIVSEGPALLTPWGLILGVVWTLVLGGIGGIAAARLTIFLFQRGWVPEYLQTAVTLMFVVGIFLLTNALRAESGLMAVTVMGIVLANQKRVNISHVVSFKEELGILLLSVLFIVLSARIELSDFAGIGWEVALFLGLLIVVIRPLAAWASTLGSQMPWQERLFVAWLAPRGIVAASVASLFALELQDFGFAGANRLVPLTFIVVVGTVTAYALTAAPLARVLGLVQKNPQGTLIVGAHGWAREIAAAIQQTGFEVWLVDTNPANVRAAQLEGLNAIHGSVLADEVIDALPLSRIGRFLALTSNGELNALAGLRLGRLLGENHIFMLASKMDGLPDVQRKMLRDHCPFGLDKGFDYIDEQFEAGAAVRIIPLEAEDTIETVKQRVSELLPMFLVADQTLRVFGRETAASLQDGQQIIGIVAPLAIPVVAPAA